MNPDAILLSNKSVTKRRILHFSISEVLGVVKFIEIESSMVVPGLDGRDREALFRGYRTWLCEMNGFVDNGGGRAWMLTRLLLTAAVHRGMVKMVKAHLYATTIKNF